MSIDARSARRISAQERVHNRGTTAAGLAVPRTVPPPRARARRRRRVVRAKAARYPRCVPHIHRVYPGPYIARVVPMAWPSRFLMRDPPVFGTSAETTSVGRSRPESSQNDAQTSRLDYLCKQRRNGAAAVDPADAPAGLAHSPCGQQPAQDKIHAPRCLHSPAQAHEPTTALERGAVLRGAVAAVVAAVAPTPRARRRRRRLQGGGGRHREDHQERPGQGPDLPAAGLALVGRLLEAGAGRRVKGRHDSRKEEHDRQGFKEVKKAHPGASLCGDQILRRHLHAIDATSPRPMQGASTAASSPRNDFVKNYRMHHPHRRVLRRHLHARRRRRHQGGQRTHYRVVLG